MKKRGLSKYIISLCVIGFLVILTMRFLVLTGRYIPLDEADRNFAADIRQHLKTTGDSILVTKIRPGDWEKVCVNPVANNMFSPRQYQLIENADTYATDYVGGIYFIQDANKVRYYRLPWNEVYVTIRQQACFDRKTAKLLAIGAGNNRKMANPKIGLPDDYLEVILTE